MDENKSEENTNRHTWSRIKHTRRRVVIDGHEIKQKGTHELLGHIYRCDSTTEQYKELHCRIVLIASAVETSSLKRERESQ